MRGQRESRREGKPRKSRRSKRGSLNGSKLTLKVVLTKMVPYMSFPYAEHILSQLEADPNAQPTADHIPIL